MPGRSHVAPVSLRGEGEQAAEQSDYDAGPADGHGVLRVVSIYFCVSLAIRSTILCATGTRVGAIGPESQGPQDLICEPTRPLNRVRCSVP